MVSAIVGGDSPDVFPHDALGYIPGDGVLAGGDENSVPRIVPQFNSGDGSSSGSFFVFPLGLSLDQGRPGFRMAKEGSSGGSIGRRILQGVEVKSSSEANRDPVQLPSLFPTFGHVQSHQIRHNPPLTIIENFRIKIYMFLMIMKLDFVISIFHSKNSLILFSNFVTHLLFTLISQMEQSESVGAKEWDNTKMPSLGSINFCNT
ncbi:hypothetical protein KSP39_PZI015701 [Platanthera zijinensis]|uniref:Uncharacterized protein n=1 Tax=Platanthera zijinensis TaxID=2320716 RepID=A0AAP0G1X3_9ASPA